MIIKEEDIRISNQSNNSVVEQQAGENNSETSNWRLEIGNGTIQIQKGVLPDEMPNDKTPNNEPWQLNEIQGVPNYVPNVEIYYNDKLFYKGSLKNGWLSKGEVYDSTGIIIYNGRIEKGRPNPKSSKYIFVYEDKEIPFDDVFDYNGNQTKLFSDPVPTYGAIMDVKIYRNNVLFYEGSVVNGWLKEGRLYDENGELKFEGKFEDGKMRIGREVIPEMFRPLSLTKSITVDTENARKVGDTGHDDDIVKLYYQKEANEQEEQQNKPSNRYFYEGTTTSRYSNSLKKGKYYDPSNGQLLYDGEFKDNQPHGFGRAYDEKGNVMYEGEFQYGRPNGKGRLFWEDGESIDIEISYQNKYSDDESLNEDYNVPILKGRNGYFYDKNGTTIPLQHDNRVYNAKMVWDNKIYVGLVKNGKPCGYGKIYDLDRNLVASYEQLNIRRDEEENAKKENEAMSSGVKMNPQVVSNNENRQPNEKNENQNKQNNKQNTGSNSKNNQPGRVAGNQEIKNENNPVKTLSPFSEEGALYKGQVKNNQPDGEGYIQFKDKQVLVGQFKNGRIIGPGMLFNSMEDYEAYKKNKSGAKQPLNNLMRVENTKIGWKGSIYIGQVYNGKPYGKGVLYIDGGKIKYEGTFKDGVFTGPGKVIFDGKELEMQATQDTSMIEIMFNNNINGADRQNINNNIKGVDKQNSVMMVWDGAIYVGNVKNGKPDGEGTLYYVDGTTCTTYSGSWVEGKKQIKGSWYNSYGKKQCEILRKENGKPYGRYWYDKNIRYEGPLNDNNKPDGKGAIYIGSPENYMFKYEGNFKDGVLEGETTITFQNGNRLTCEVKNGKFIAPGTLYDKDNKVIYGNDENGNDKPIANYTCKYDGAIISDGNLCIGSVENGKQNSCVVYNANGQCVCLRSYLNGQLGYETYQYSNGNHKYSVNYCCGGSPKAFFKMYDGCMTYEVPLKDNQAEGEATLMFKNEMGLKLKFEKGKLTEIKDIEQSEELQKTLGKEQLFKWENGIYIGEAQDKKPNGKGVFYTFENGEWKKYEGEWKEGERISGKQYAPDGNLLYDVKYEDGYESRTLNGNLVLMKKIKNDKEFDTVTIGCTNKDDQCIIYTGKLVNGKLDGEVEINIYNNISNKNTVTCKFKDGKIVNEKMLSPQKLNTNSKKKDTGSKLQKEALESGICIPTDEKSSLVKLYNYEGWLQYEGEVKDGKPHGRGTLYYRADGLLKYEGEFKNGKPNGKGVLDRDNGAIKYEGNFKDGVLEGDVTIIFQNGSKLKCRVDNGKFIGLGTLCDADDNVIYGEDKQISSYTYPSKGKIIWNGNLYIGDVENGLPNGKGTVFNAKGELLYDGNFKPKDFPQGTNATVKQGALEKGVLYDANGVKLYEGEFENNKPHGKGKLYTDGGEIIHEGEFENGKLIKCTKTIFKDGSYWQQENSEGHLHDASGRDQVYVNKWCKSNDVNDVLFKLQTGQQNKYWLSGEDVLCIGIVDGNGKLSGQGELYDLNGKKHYSGTWEGTWMNSQLAARELQEGTYSQQQDNKLDKDHVIQTIKYQNKDSTDDKPVWTYTGIYRRSVDKGNKEVLTPCGFGEFTFPNGDRLQCEYGSNGKSARLAYICNYKNLDKTNTKLELGMDYMKDGVYQGYFDKKDSQGNRHKRGLGVFYDQNGDKYYGYWYNDVLTYGVHYDAYGKKKYEGEFNSNLDYCGKGVQYLNDGKTRCEGTFFCGKRRGEGKMIFEDGNTFEYYVADKKTTYCINKKQSEQSSVSETNSTSQAKMITQDGLYIGQVQDGKPHGKGKLYYENGALKYEGEYQKGLWHGKGKLYDENGMLFYEGTFEGGYRNGKGKLYSENGQLRYEGKFKNDKYDGEGKLYYKYGMLLYEGNYQNGARNGKGKTYYENGVLKREGLFENDKFNEGKLYDKNGKLQYEGEFEDYKFNGKGTLYYENKNKQYEGDFANNKFDGEGKLYNENGMLKYEGTFKNGELDGDVKMHLNTGEVLNCKFKKGRMCKRCKKAEDIIEPAEGIDDDQYCVVCEDYIYIGQIKNNGKRNGQGKLYDKDGYLWYDGQFLNDLPYGKGTYYSKSLKPIYSGQFIYNTPHGKGELYDENGNIQYFGEFKHGLREGKGSEYYENGDTKYKGEFKNDKFDGEGILYDERGETKYKGMFKNGLLNGKCTIIFNDGDTLECTFKNGRTTDAGAYTNSGTKNTEKNNSNSKNNKSIKNGQKSTDKRKIGWNGGIYVGEVNEKGEPDGKGEIWFDNGKLKYKGKFKNGVLEDEGEIIFCDSRNLSLKCCFQGGKPVKAVGESTTDKISKSNLKPWQIMIVSINRSSYLLYIGEVDKQGKQNGKGRLYDLNGVLKYEGEFQGGLCHGKGKLYYENGVLKYEGEFKEGCRDGQGKLYYENGVLKYEGEFKEGKPNSKGTLYHENGVLKYEGEFKEGKPNGKGTLYHENGNRQYDGEFANGTPNGKGKLYYENGKLRYDGEWRNGLVGGRGKSYYASGKVLYDGEWLNGCAYGKGELYDNNGVLRYKGEFVNGKFNGEGRLNDENGELRYDGEWKNGLADGEGATCYKSGQIQYNGKWQAGCAHGKGRLYDNDKRLQYEGEWKNGFVEGEGTLYYRNGEIQYNGKWQAGFAHGKGKLNKEPNDSIWEHGVLRGEMGNVVPKITLRTDDKIVIKDNIRDTHEEVVSGLVIPQIDISHQRNFNYQSTSANAEHEVKAVGNKRVGSFKQNNLQPLGSGTLTFDNGVSLEATEYTTVPGFEDYYISLKDGTSVKYDPVFKTFNIYWGGAQCLYNNGFDIQPFPKKTKDYIYIGEVDQAGNPSGFGHLYNKNMELVFKGDFGKIAIKNGFCYNAQGDIWFNGIIDNWNKLPSLLETSKTVREGVLWDNNEGNVSYSGTLVNNIPNGEGILYLNDGKIKCHGKFKNGKPEGKVRIVLQDAKYSMFSGYYFDCVFEDGNVKEIGKWCSYDGKEIEIPANIPYCRLMFVGNNLYFGDVVNNKPNGKGVLYVDGGKIQYKGTFKNGVLEGDGQIIFENGDTLECIFENGKIKNRGIAHYRRLNVKPQNYTKMGWQGGLYIGQVHFEKPDGAGVLYLNNGAIKYEGIFVEGRLEGKGKIIFDSGETLECIFKHGKIIEYIKPKEKVKEQPEKQQDNNVPSVASLFAQFSHLADIWRYMPQYGQCKHRQEPRQEDDVKLESHIILHAECLYDTDRKLRYYGQMRNGKPYGLGMAFDEKGHLQYKGSFVDGVPHGSGYVFSDNGKLFCELQFVNGICQDTHVKLYKTDGVKVEATQNNLLYDGTIVNNKPHGQGALYVDGGKIQYKGTFKDGVLESDVTIFNDKQEMTARCQFSNDKLTNITRLFLPNGISCCFGQLYIGDVDDNLQPSGKGKIFFMDGTSSEVEITEDKNKVKRVKICKNYDLNGQEIKGSALGEVYNGKVITQPGNMLYIGPVIDKMITTITTNKKTKQRTKQETVVTTPQRTFQCISWDGKIMPPTSMNEPQQQPAPKDNDTTKSHQQPQEKERSIVWNGQIYRGQVNDKGRPDGKGKIIFDDADYVECEFEDGERISTGKIYYNNRSEIITPKNNEISTTKMVLNNWIYIGQVKQGMPHGTGKIIFEDGTSLEGEFLDGKPTNKVLCYNAKGEADYTSRTTEPDEVCETKLVVNGWIYVGQVKNGEPYGEGAYYAMDGKMWCQVSKEGEPEEQQLVTEFFDDNGEVMQPNSMVFFDNGLIYKGETKQQEQTAAYVPDGKGELYDATGKKVYEGSFSNGKKHGKGRIYRQDGSIQLVEFEEGQQLQQYDNKVVTNAVFKSQQEYDQYQTIISHIIEGSLCARDFNCVTLSNSKFLAALTEYNAQQPHNEQIHRYTYWDKFWSFGESNARIRRRNQLGKMLEGVYTKNLNQDEKINKKTPYSNTKKWTKRDLLNISNMHNRWDLGFQPATI